MNNCPLRQSRQPSTRWLLGAARVLRTQPRTSARKYALRRLCTELQKYRGSGENWPSGEGRGQTGHLVGPEVAGKPCRDRPKQPRALTESTVRESAGGGRGTGIQHSPPWGQRSPVPRLPWRAHVGPTRPVNLPDVRFTSNSYRALALQRNDATCQSRLNASAKLAAVSAAF